MCYSTPELVHHKCDPLRAYSNLLHQIDHFLIVQVYNHFTGKFLFDVYERLSKVDHKTLVRW